MLHTMKRGLLVGSVVVVVAALLSGAALAQRGHGNAFFGIRAAHAGGAGGFAQFGPGARFFGGPGGGFGRGGFGGPMFGGPGFGGPGFDGPGLGMGGGPGAGLLASNVLTTAAATLKMSL